MLSMNRDRVMREVGLTKKQRAFCLSAAACAAVLLALSSCRSLHTGKYFEDDGPPAFSDASSYEGAPNAVVRLEKPVAAANRPYTVNGKRYYPMTGDKPLTQTGMASWYGKKFHGKKTSIGERYNMYAMTAAHPTMELPSYARVTNLANGRTIIVRVNDRGPFLNNRIIDLSYAAASKLGYVKNGTALVRVERITRAQIASGKVGGGGRLGSVEVVKVNKDVRADALAIEAVIAALHAEEPESAKDSGGSRSAAPSAGAVEAAPVQKTAPRASQSAPSDDTVADLLAAGEKLKEEGAFVDLSGQGVLEPVKEDGGYYLQAGVFSIRENAERLAEELRAGTAEPVEIYETDGRYRVLVGSPKTKEEASEAVKNASGGSVRYVPFKKQAL